MTTLPGFVFVHGAWHNADTWRMVLPLLRAQGFVAEALDLPGAGQYAQAPHCFSQQPPDPVAVATEPSPNAGVSQEARTAAVSAKVREVAAQANGQVVLVGHSLGGLTISHVVEAHPEQIAAVVYLAALLLPPGISVFALNQEPAMPVIAPEQRFEQLLLADPAVVGAARVNWQATDPAYAAKFKEFLYPGVDEQTYRQFMARSHSDEPAAVFPVPSPITPARFGTVPRHYIHTTQDQAVQLATQEYMRARVDAVMPTPTIAHTLPGGHSPFASQPEALAELLADIAGSVQAFRS